MSPARPVQPAPRPVFSLVVRVEEPGAWLHRSLQAMQAATKDAPTEIILALKHPWSEAPPGVAQSVCNSHSTGERLDRAAAMARGKYVAFLDARVRLEAAWQQRALEQLADPATAAVGGPIIARPTNVGERITSQLMRSYVGAARSRHVSHGKAARAVGELSTSNMVVNASAFAGVGGFQSPARGGQSARLCYKFRQILGMRVMYHPDLAVRAAPPPFMGGYLKTLSGRGRDRGDLARRLRVASPLLPYALPAILIAGICVLIVAAPFSRLARLALLVVGTLYVLEALRTLISGDRVGVRLAACLALPLVPAAYALGFVSGFFGPSLSEISPRGTRDRPYRVLIMNWRDVAHPWSGGAEAYMHEIGRRLAARGFEVGWLSARFAGSRRVETIDGIRVHRVGGRYTLYAMVALAFLWKLRNRYDMVIDCENGIPFFSPLYTRKPVVLVVHHVHQEVFRRELPRSIRWLPLWLEGWLMPRAYRRCPIVAVSESTKQALVAQGFKESAITIVSNGVDPPARIRQPRATRPTLVYSGRLKPYKSVDVLIRAMPQVLAALPQARLEIVGQGPDRTRLEQIAWSLRLAGSVRFHGYLPGAERDAVLASAWVAICPSAFEGWGIACMEASARGIPVVASRVPGLRDSVRDGETGVLVPYGDPAALARELCSLLTDRPRRSQMATAGRAWAAQHSWERAAGELALIIGSQLRQRALSWTSYDLALDDRTANVTIQ